MWNIITLSISKVDFGFIIETDTNREEQQPVPDFQTKCSERKMFNILKTLITFHTLTYQLASCYSFCTYISIIQAHF